MRLVLLSCMSKLNLKKHHRLFFVQYSSFNIRFFAFHQEVDVSIEAFKTLSVSRELSEVGLKNRWQGPRYELSFACRWLAVKTLVGLLFELCIIWNFSTVFEAYADRQFLAKVLRIEIHLVLNGNNPVTCVHQYTCSLSSFPGILESCQFHDLRSTMTLLPFASVPSSMMFTELFPYYSLNLCQL